MKNNIIPTEIVEKISKKYGIKNTRKMIRFYDSGLPEKYWGEKYENKKLEKYADECLELLDKNSNILIISDKIKNSTEIISYIAKKCIIRKENVKIIDFVFLSSEISDRFGQIDFSILDKLKNKEKVFFTGIKRYGKVYDRLYPAFASIVNTLINSSVFEKKIIFEIGRAHV